MIKKQSLLARTMKARKQRGLSLAEAGLVLALGMLVAVIAFAGYSFGSNSIKTRSQVSATIELTNNVVRTFSSAGDYTNLTEEVMINSSMVPTGFRNTATAIFNTWGGAVELEPVEAAPNTFTVTVKNVPKASCVDFVTGVASAANIITVGGEEVKAAGAAVSINDLAEECAKAATAEIVITTS